MANVYVKASGSNTSPYDTWAKAATTLATATGFASANDVIYAHQESETITVDTTYTLANGVRIICSNDAVNEPPQTLGNRTITSTTAGVDINLNSATNGWGYIYGLIMQAATGASIANIQVNGANNSTLIIFESCTFQLQSSSASSRIAITSAAIATLEQRTITRNCTFIWGATAQGFDARGFWESDGDDFVGGATVPTTLFKSAVGPLYLRINGGDLSDVTGTEFGAPTGFMKIELYGCKLGSGVTIAPTFANLGEGEILVYDCDAGDVHYAFAHYNYAGSTVISTSIYANTGASYNGTNFHSWVVASNANANFYSPYVTPWIPVYHDGTSAITPALEIVRSGSSTAYQNDEVWAEFSYKGTASSSRVSTVNNRMALLGTAANITTGALGASDWTGESGTSWFGKLETSSITPAEIGHLSARVCVGEPSITVYVDPQIRERT